jgi:general secretion pathway protein F
MAIYEYQALARSGKKVKGVIDADTASAARRKLREQNMFPTAINESFRGQKMGKQARRLGLGRVSQRDVAIMTRQLAVLLQAGMPLVEALSALLEQTSNARLQKVIYDVRDKVNEGARLADALGGHRRVFSELYINMVGAGEASGALEQVLFRLADIMERQVRVGKRVQGALAYPAFMVVVGVFVISFLMAAIIPKITEMFQRQGRDLPAITEVLIATSTFIRSYWPFLIVAVIALFVLWRFWVSRPEGRRHWDRLKLHVPLFSDLYIKLVTSRFCRTLGTMLNSGLTMMTSLEVVKTVVENKVVEDNMNDVKASVRRGQDLAVPLRNMDIFPPMMLSMVELGQRSGELEDMLIRVADTYDEEVELAVETLVGLIEPAIIVVMALFVGFLVVSILLPIVEISSGV